jgi:hypothetical protein
MSALGFLGKEGDLYPYANEEHGLTKNLIRLTYVSTLQPQISDADIDGLVSRAATFNKSQGITGVLAIDNQRVCQILEGAKQDIERLFLAIRNDQRHHTVTEIETRAIEASSFENWGMVRRDMVDMVMYALA